MNLRGKVEVPTAANSTPNFLDLPLKVRFDIYRIFLAQKRSFTPLHRQPIKEYLEVELAQKALLRAGVRLLRICKQISDEATSVLYGENAFTFRPDNIDKIPEFLNSIGRSNCSKISLLDVNLEYSQEKQWRGRWSSQPGVEEVLTKREYVFGLADGNKFLPDYPVAGQVFFADLSTVEDAVPTVDFEDCEFESNLTTLKEDFDALRSEDLYDGYPSWKQEWVHAFSHVDPPAMVVGALESIAQCCNLHRLELWFPDPQRFALGYGCLREDKVFLRYISALKGLSELFIHGMDELPLIETIAVGMNIPKVIAELNCSRARPFLHVEAGRPNLRANPSWRVLRSDRYTLTLELRKGDYVRRDMFSTLPTEVRALIYDYLFPCWFETFRGNYHCDWRPEVNYPFILLQDLSFGCQRTNSESTSLSGGVSLLALNRKLNAEITAILYSQCIFSTTPPNGPNRSCCPQTDHGLWFNPNFGLLINFLAHIGPRNQRLIRHLYIGLHSFVSFPKPAKQLRSPYSFKQHTASQHATFCSPLSTRNVSWKIARLVTLVREIHGLGSVTLRFSDGVDSATATQPVQHREPPEEDDFSVSKLTGKHMLNANYYLNVFSKLQNVKHLEIAGCLGMTDSELFARLIGAETIAVRRNEERSRMIHQRRALNDHGRNRAQVEARAKACGWAVDGNEGYGCFVKRLTADNITPAVARRLWAATDMEEDIALIADYSDELDIRGQ